MKTYLRPVILLKKVDAENLFTAAQFKAKKELPFRITINNESKFVSAVPLGKCIDNSQIGLNPVWHKNGDVTVDALITPVTKGDFIPCVANPAYGKMAWAHVAPLYRVDNPEDYAFKDYRLRNTFLPCDDEKLYTKFESLNYAIATVNHKTQKVTDFRFVRDFGFGVDSELHLGTIESVVDDEHINVACYLANAGFNFTRFVK